MLLRLCTLRFTKPGFLWQGDFRSVKYVWFDYELCFDLFCSDDFDDREFQVTHKQKRDLRTALSENFLTDQSVQSNFASRDEDNPRTSRNEQERAEDPRTSAVTSWEGDHPRTSHRLTDQSVQSNFVSRDEDNPRTSRNEQERAEDPRTSAVTSWEEEHPRTSRTAEERAEDPRTSRDHDNFYHQQLEGLANLAGSLQLGSGFPSNREAVERARFDGKILAKKCLTICELFSPPRVALEAKGFGFQTTEPPAFDRETGWEFFSTQCRADFWNVVRSQKPDITLMTPDCKPFSQIMESNWKRMDEKEAQGLQGQGLAMLHFLEQPGGAPSWATHGIAWLLKQPGVIRFLFDQCSVGLSVSEGELSRKTTGIATNHAGIAAVLSQCQCSKNHPHVVLDQGLTAPARIFPLA